MCINKLLHKQYSPGRAVNINSINDIGRQQWQKSSNYNFRNLVETIISRYKKIIGTMVHSKKLSNQKQESKIGCYILNKIMDFGMPRSFKFVASNC